jgi:UDP-N-acetyl-2-amino-2-deoxyglucuronate dehydrogenase
MSERMGIGVIGAGEITMKATAPGIAASQYARLAVAMDARRELAQDIAARYGARWTASVDALLSDAEVEAVYVAVPHYLHRPLTVQALAAGKHVLVEKPIATTLADADAMIAAASQAGRVLSVAFEAQYDDRMVRLRELIAAGLIGRITGTRIVSRGDKAASYWTGGYTGRVQTDWRTKRETSGGGVLIMNTIHDLNTLRFLTGLEPVRVYAEYDNYATPVEVEDYIAVTIRYANGAIGTLEAGSALPGRDPAQPKDRIYGDRGQIVLGDPVTVYLREPVETSQGLLPAGEWLPLDLGAAAPDRGAMIDKFVLAIRARCAPPVTGLDGRNALAVALAAYRSGELHQPVELG